MQRAVEFEVCGEVACALHSNAIAGHIQSTQPIIFLRKEHTSAKLKLCKESAPTQNENASTYSESIGERHRSGTAQRIATQIQSGDVSVVFEVQRNDAASRRAERILRQLPTADDGSAGRAQRVEQRRQRPSAGVAQRVMREWEVGECGVVTQGMGEGCGAW
jgi:hypothetical protein